MILYTRRAVERFELAGLHRPLYSCHLAIFMLVTRRIHGGIFFLFTDG